MANKYMTLEEAAAYLHISVDKLKRLREQGEIRGFADRGSWKFTRESIEELGRMMEADSSPDIPIISDIPIGSDEPDMEVVDADEPMEIDFDDAFFEDDEAAPAAAAMAQSAEAIDEIEVEAADSDIEVDYDDSFFEDDEEDAVEVELEDNSEGVVSEEVVQVADDSGEEMEIDFDDAFFEDDDEETVAPVAEEESSAPEAAAPEVVSQSELPFESSDSDVQADFDEAFFDDDDEQPVDVESTLVDTPDSDVELVGEEVDMTIVDEEDEVEGALELNASDSDVRLAFDESMFDSDADAEVVAPDSDVQLAGDSDLNLEGEGSAEDTAATSVLDFAEGIDETRDSDSDVQLVDQELDSDSDVSIVTGTDADIRLDREEAPTLDNSSDDSSMILPGLETDGDIELASTMFSSPDLDASADGSLETSSTDDPSSASSMFMTSGADDQEPPVTGSTSDDSSDMMAGVDSDADIELVEQTEIDASELDSDSDIYLVSEDDPADDSDVHLVDDAMKSGDSSSVMPGVDSDSDIRLAEAAADDSSALLQTDSDIQLTGDDDGDAPGVADTDSDIRLSDAVNESDESSHMLLGADAASDLQMPNASDESSRMLVGFDSDSDVRLAAEVPPEEPSSESSRMVLGIGSDSDVQVSSPDSSSDDSSGVLPGLDSDSDVRLDSGDSGARLSIPDSELPLFDSDSDVRLSVDGSDLLQGLDPTGKSGSGAGSTPPVESDVVVGGDSDSDINLVDLPLATDDSDVILTSDDSGDEDLLPGLFDDEKSSFDSGATVAMKLPDDSDLKLIDSSVSISDESGISLEVGNGMLMLDADESGISLEIDDSGISLEADDSGISLESLDSGAMMSLDSGISLDVDDSGITLDADDSGITLDAGDSGIALFDDDDSGISMDPDDMGQTQPMSDVAGAMSNLGVSGANTMEMDIPAGGGTNDSEFELAGLDDDDDDFGTDTSVLMFDDDDAGGEFSVASQPGVGSATDDLEMEDLDSDDSFEDDLGADEFEDDFDDEEEMDDVWDAEDQDEDDEEGFESGESQVGGFVAPAGAAAAAGGWAMADDRPWGTGWTVGVSFGALLSALSAFVGVELVRTMWMWTQPGQPSSSLLSMLGGMFGS